MSELIPPIEASIRQAVAHQFQTRFGVMPVIAQSSDDILRAKAQRVGNKELTYPIAYIKLGALRRPSQGFFNRYLHRRGLIYSMGNKQNTALAMRVLNIHQDFEVTIEVDRAEGPENSVDFFVRRWMFVAETRGLSVKVRYGGTSKSDGTTIGGAVFGVPVTLNSDLTYPERQAVTNEDSCYRLVGSGTIMGFISELEPKPVGIVREINIDGRVGE